MKVLLTLDKENMQNMDNAWEEKKLFAVTTILNVIDIHIERWENENLKHKTQTKTQDQTHGKSEGKHRR